MTHKYTIPTQISPSSEIVTKIESFLQKFKTAESENGISLVLHYDSKSSAYYVVCHIGGETLVKF